MLVKEKELKIQFDEMININQLLNKVNGGLLLR